MRAEAPHVGVYEGLRVVEVGGGIPAATAAMYLGDFGASVVKVAAPGPPDDPGSLCWDRNKWVIPLDYVACADDRATTLALLSAADVAITDFVPGEAEKYGFDGPTLLGLNDALIAAWLPPYGVAGSWSQLPQDELLLDALGSVADAHVADEDAAVFPATPAISYAHGALAAAAIAAAIVERDAVGSGGALCVSGLHGLAVMMCPLMAEAPGVIRLGAHRGIGNPGLRMYQAGDGNWFQLYAITPKFLLRALETLDLLDVMTMPGIDGDPLKLLFFDPTTAGPAAERIERRFKERSAQEWCDVLMAARVPVAPVTRREDWLDSEIVAANDMKVVLDDGDGRVVSVPGVPVRLHATPGRVLSLPTTTGAPLEDVWFARPRDDGSEARVPASRAGSSRPLDGLRVIDLSTFIAAPLVTGILADFGADVIKVEPVDGDPYRIFSVGYVAVNQRKRGMALDIRQPRGYELLLQLVRDADVLVHNFSPGVDTEIGVDYPSLERQNPRLVHYSVSAFGRHGSLAGTPGFDQLLQARSGFAAAQGGDGPPEALIIPVHDTTAGAIGAFGIVAALHARAVTGRGQEVTASLASVATIIQAGELTTFAGRAAPLRGAPNFPGPGALRRFYPCADAWIALAASTEAAGRAVLDALGCSPYEGKSMLDEPHNGQLAELIGNALAVLPSTVAIECLAAHDVACAPVLSRDEAMSSPWLEENAFFHEFDDRDLGRCRVVRTYCDWADGAAGIARTAGRVGEYTVELLTGLGCSPDEIETLCRDRITRTDV